MPNSTLSERMVEALRQRLQTRGYSPRTVDTYVEWVRRFMTFHHHPHPRALDHGHIRLYLRHLATLRELAAKTRNQAASALTFLYRDLLDIETRGLIEHARGEGHVPVVLAHTEVQRLLEQMKGRKKVAAGLLYGTGARISEALSLRVKDIDFELGRISIHDGKGGKARVVMLPHILKLDLEQICRDRAQRHRQDREAGHGWAPLPAALHRKTPEAGFELAWQFIFPSRKLATDPKTGHRGRHPLHPTALQRAVKRAVRQAGIHKPATCHTLRHSFATQMLRDGYDIRTVQQLLGHKDVRTTMIYLHVVDQVGFHVRSPLDRDKL